MSFGATFHTEQPDAEETPASPLRMYELAELLELARAPDLGEHSPLAVFQALQSEFRHLRRPFRDYEAEDLMEHLLSASDLFPSWEERHAFWEKWTKSYEKRIEEWELLADLLSLVEAELSPP
jgi:hypothetical protein